MAGEGCGLTSSQLVQVMDLLLACLRVCACAVRGLLFD